MSWWETLISIISCRKLHYIHIHKLNKMEKKGVNNSNILRLVVFHVLKMSSQCLSVSVLTCKALFSPVPTYRHRSYFHWSQHLGGQYHLGGTIWASPFFCMSTLWYAWQWHWWSAKKYLFSYMKSNSSWIAYEFSLAWTKCVVLQFSHPTLTGMTTSMSYLSLKDISFMVEWDMVFCMPK